MKIIDIAFFAYAVSNMKTARAFYEGVLGLSPNSEYDGSGNPNWVEYDIGTSTLGVGCAPGMFDPSPKMIAPGPYSFSLIEIEVSTLAGNSRNKRLERKAWFINVRRLAFDVFAQRG